MTRMRRALATTATAATALLLLSACALGPQPVVTRLPTDGPVSTGGPVPTSTAPADRPSTVPSSAPSSDAAGPDALVCDGTPLVLTSGSASPRVTGDCPDVKVQGADLSVDLTAATVGSLELSGDRLRVSAGTVKALTVQGNDTVVQTADADAVVVRGDRNALTAAGAADTVQVAGNGNTITTAGVGAVRDEGSGNDIR